MTVTITTRAAAALPSAGEATLFLDSGNNNALTAKYSDNTFKTLSGEPVQFTVAEPLKEILDLSMKCLSQSAAKGVITMAEFQTFVSNLNWYYESSLDANGNLQQSISTTPPAP